jgi:diamine N-acetyltransferase
LDYLFNDLLLHQAHCVIDETNIDSQRLFENQGFTLCGRRKDWIKTEKGFIDELEYQLMKSIQIL